MKFSEKIIKLRKENGLSQEELGNKINVSRQAISKWESEQSQPEVEKVKEISKVFGVSIEYLLNDEFEENKKIQDRKDNRKNKKLVFKILIAIIITYVVISLFKFTLLLICYIRANNIADYENYEISIDSSIHDVLENEPRDFAECYIYKNGIQQIELYDFKNNFAQTITYISPKNNKAYTLNYDEEIEKYVYEDLRDDEEFSYEEYENNKITLKERTLMGIPNIFIAAIDPRVTVSFDDTYFYIDTNYKRTYSNISINKETGILESVYMKSDMITSYTRMDFWIEDLVDEIDQIEPIEYENYITIEELEEI